MQIAAIVVRRGLAQQVSTGEGGASSPEQSVCTPPRCLLPHGAQYPYQNPSSKPSQWLPRDMDFEAKRRQQPAGRTPREKSRCEGSRAAAAAGAAAACRRCLLPLPADDRPSPAPSPHPHLSALTAMRCWQRPSRSERSGSRSVSANVRRPQLHDGGMAAPLVPLPAAVCARNGCSSTAPQWRSHSSS